MTSIANTDERLREGIATLTDSNRNFWSFKGRTGRKYSHAFFQYPAMMVPRMQRKLIGAVRAAQPEVSSVFDPFVGSGTVMAESMLRGMDFKGNDVNPLAVLICRSKLGPFFEQSIETKQERLTDAIKNSKRKTISIDFPGISKWFQEDVAVELSKIRGAILNEDSLWARRFFWVALAETVRLTSNSRTSTYKLHIRSEEDIDSREIDTFKVFRTVLSRNVEHFLRKKKILERLAFVSKGRYIGSADISLVDSKKKAEGGNTREDGYDLLITSPPYGDNVTTVPYGQYSYLPLQWIRLEDIDSSLSSSCLKTTHEIDRQSLGGSREVDMKDTDLLKARSVNFGKFLKKIEKEEQGSGQQRFVSFCRDLNDCIDPILSRLKQNAYMIWVVGNRRINGHTMPFDTILGDFLVSRGAIPIVNFKRKIHSKKMAFKNNISNTMKTETILILRKG